MQESSEFYTKEQVMEKLEVAASTVYHLAKSKRIEMEILPEGVSRTKRYSKSSVDHYYLIKNSIPNGLSINDFAKLHKVTTQRLYQLINKLDLSIDKVVVGKRQRLILNAEQQRILQQELGQKTHKGTKSDFYLSKVDIALFQLFTDDNKQPYRIVRNERNEWGFIMSFSNQFLSFKEALVKQKLTPSYAIHQPSIASTMYINFRLKANHPSSYDFLDHCYTYLGIENMHMLQKGDELQLSLKAVNIPVINNPSMLDYLNDCCLNAVIDIFEGHYNFHIQDRAVTVTLKGDVYSALKQAATEQKISLADLINQLIEQQLMKK